LFNQNDNINEFKTKFILSSCGWSYNANKGILSCNKCLRSIGLWLYKVNNEDNEIIENILNKIINTIEIKQGNFENLNDENFNQLSSKRKCDILNDDVLNIDRKSKKTLNPLHEHHSWCPWLIVQNQKLNCCQINFSTIVKCLQNDNRTSLNSTVSKITDITLDRIKSVQKLLIDCTPKCMLSS
jgi:hypothetical protein